MGLSRRLRLIALLYLHKKKSETTARRRRWSVRPLNRNRRTLGQYYSLVINMRNQDPERFFRTFRMDVIRFDDLLSRISHLISHNPTAANPVPPAERLAIALRILAQGETQQSVAISFMLGVATVSKILAEVCNAIWSALQPEFLPEPDLATFTATAMDFWRFWHFPMCCGAIDGKHIQIKCPNNSGSRFFNYKGTFSIILMACVDAQYRFSMIDTGGFGSQGDAGTFNESRFGQAILNDTLPIPPPNFLPGTHTVVSHAFVADEAFPLRMNILRPFPRQQLNDARRIFNYRLSRARRIVENAFGILVARWRILLKPIEMVPEKVDIITNACVLLHNFLKKTDAQTTPQMRYVPPNFVDYEAADGTIHRGQWRAEVEGLRDAHQLSSNMYSRKAGEMRDKFVAYFRTDNGSIPNQELAALSC